MRNDDESEYNWRKSAEAHDRNGHRIKAWISRRIADMADQEEIKKEKQEPDENTENRS
jgi:hypothetical protein